MFYVFNFRKIKKYILFLLIVLTTGVLAYTAVSWYYPLRYIDVIKDKSKKYNIDPVLVCAVIHAESKFDQMALSNKGAGGLMQLMEDTAYWGAEEIGISEFQYSDIFEPEMNIEIGCWYLDRLMKQFSSEAVALAAYNAGSGNVSKWLKNIEYSSDGESLDTIPFTQTEEYLKRINFNKKIYKLILR